MLFLFAFQKDTDALYYQVAAVPQDGVVLLLEELDELCLFAYTGETPGSGHVVALDRTTGQITAQYSSDHNRIFWAAVRGDCLMLVECDGSTAYLTRLSLSALQKLDSRPLPVATEELVSFDCDGEGSFYFADPSDGNALWISGADGSLQKVEELDSVTFLEITPGGTIFAVSGLSYFWGPARDPQQWQSTVLTLTPQYLLEEEYFVIKPFFTLYQYSNGTTSQVNDLSLPSDPLLCALDREDHLLYAGDDSTLQCASLSGEPLDSVTLRGTLLAVCGNGAIVQEEGSYWFTPIQFFQEPATPTPQVTPTPTPEVSPSPEISPSPEVTPSTEPSPEPSPTPSSPPTFDDIVQEGDYLVMPIDVTLSQLLSYFAPDAVEVCRPDGTVVTSGNLATGMTAGGYTLVVLGDCDSSGSLTQKDLRAAQDLLLTSDVHSDPYRRAADINGDGIVTTVDLILLAQDLSS